MTKIGNAIDVLILSHNEAKGGAARAALRWLLCFSENNISSKMLVAKKFTSNDSVNELGYLRKILCKFISRLDLLVCKIIEPTGHEWKSSGYFGCIPARSLNKYNFSILNIHWIGHGLISLRQLKKINKPIIWTLHDEWILNPFSHYTNHSPNKVPSIINILKNQRLKAKNEIILKDNFYFLCLTKSLADKLISKYPSKKDRISIVPNPLDLSIFYPEKNNKEFISLDIDQPYFLFLGGVTDRRKGWDLLQESVKATNSEYTLVVVGNLEDKDLSINSKVRIVTINEITDKNLLRILYSNARAVLIPSRAEQLPQVATESISCGTPVIAYSVDGLRDIIIPLETGILINAFDTTSFGLAIDELVNMNEDIWELRCLNFAERNFSYKVVADKFKKLFDLANISS